MLISYRGEVGEKVACQVEMAIHTKALLEPGEHSDLSTFTIGLTRSSELDGILKHGFRCAKNRSAVLTDAIFLGSAAQ